MKVKLISRNRNLEDEKASLEEQLEEEEEARKTMETKLQQANHAVKIFVFF